MTPLDKINSDIDKIMEDIEAIYTILTGQKILSDIDTFNKKLLIREAEDIANER
jgi:hypothetical protein